MNLIENVHIKIQNRNANKKITIVQGLDTGLNLKLIIKFWKKEFNCGGTIIDDMKYGKIIQLSGDQRQNVMNFLIDEKICDKNMIKNHGY